MKNEIISGLINNGIIIPANKAIHLAIVNEPFLTYIKTGEKIIESRFTKNNIPPYNQIEEGDIVCMKAAGSPIDSFFIAGKVLYFLNNELVFQTIRNEYSKPLCAFDESFWTLRKEKKYITLIEVKSVQILSKPFNISKKDKRAWVKYPSSFMEDIILIAGKIGSGKTFWAKEISQLYNCCRASFSDYIKKICRDQCREINRSNLQEIGTAVINNDMDGLINYALQQCNSTRIVIDGLRHINVYKRMKHLYPSTNIIIVYIDCDETQRQQNLSLRGEDTHLADLDVTEQGYEEIKKVANIVFTYSESPADEIKKHLAPLLTHHSLLDF